MQEVKEKMSSDTNALASALSRVGDRWSLLVVEALIDGPRRYADLQTAVPGIATNVLSQRLRQLESDRVLMAVPYSRKPVRYSYELTDVGRDLAGAARLLAQWSADHGIGEGQGPLHAQCGTALMARWWCSTCDQLADSPSEAVWV
jgi:DNA-binding HxlR family transcriptional regulator